MSERKETRINLSEFMNTTEELHAFTHGICEVLCPWPPYRKAMAEDRARELEAEYQYYQLGRAAGVIAWIIIAIVIKGVFF